MVYASDSRALACLETVMHLGADLPLNRYLVEIRIPDAIWQRRVVFEPRNHIGWDAEPPGEVSIDWGSAWAHGGSTLLGQVPSVIVPEEPKVLINARHRDAGRLKAIKVRRWTSDTRLR